MQSRDYFSIGTAGNSNTYGLYCDTPPMMPMSAQKYDEVSIPDREETLYYARDVFEDVTITVKAYTFDNNVDIARIYNWLRHATELRFSGDDVYYYKVKKVLGITPSYSGHGKNLYNIGFVVSPFKYFQDDNILTVESPSTFSVYNTGNHWSRPVYKIYGSGDITLKATANGEETKLTIYNVNGHCTVDGERLLVYKETTSGTKTTRTSLMTSGEIPMLVAGNTNFTTTTTGTCTKIEVKKNKRST